MTHQYQLFEPLPALQFDALKADIAKRGILVPVEIDEATGETLDGHHRLAIAKELGIECPKVYRSIATEAGKIDHVLKINLLRRHMDEVSWGEAFARLLEARGVKRGQGARNDRTSDTVSEVAAEVGVNLRTAERRLEAAALPEPLKKAVKSGEKSVKQAKAEHKKATRKAKKAKAKATKPADLPPVPDRCTLICSPIADVKIEPNSIDWIITDPPYPKDALGVYEALSAFAAHALKPGGSLVCMVGQSYLPTVIAALSSRMEYHWTLAYLTPGGQAVQLWQRKVNTFWKPLLWFRKPGPEPKDWIGDVCRSDVNDNDKRHHGWGQSESGMRDVIERFTFPGQVVCDPFLGGGTTGVVALDMDRVFIGIDRDQKCLDAFRARLP